jgi:ubiquinone/menaquinone biosynthesis C-methylase UbiE
MGRFWDARAREDAMFFVDDREPYGQADEARFWKQGERDLDHVLGGLGAQIVRGDTVVDVGCGVGRLTRVIAGRAARVYAIDVSAEMLAQARDHNAQLHNVEWVHGDGTTLRPIPDAVANAVISHVVFQHVPDPRITYGYVAEMGRVLRPGGWAAFQVSNDPSIHRATQSLGQRVKAAVGRAPRGQGDPKWLGSAVDLDELRATAERAGMEAERIEGEGTQFCLVLVRRSS